MKVTKAKDAAKKNQQNKFLKVQQPNEVRINNYQISLQENKTYKRKSIGFRQQSS